ncbi:MAG: TniQ family protein [Wenzhouxiangella sp.]|jgi:hypothetical protein|nr:TniQ family protein [Wenzhouxiangella sp.]
MIDVTVGPRYSLIAGHRWPIDVFPRAGELLSSWLHRLAHANGIPPRHFGAVIGCRAVNWTARLDRSLTTDILETLVTHTAVPRDVIAALALSPDPLSRMRLPLHPMPRADRTEAATAFWLQYCPACLAEDEHPYFHRAWTLATRVTCFRHGCPLRDRCPACRAGIAPFAQARLVGQRFCAFCGADLAVATGRASHGIRRAERLIDDLLRLHQTGHRARSGRSILTLLGSGSFRSGKISRPLSRMALRDRLRLLRRVGDGIMPMSFAGPSASATYWRCIARAAWTHVSLAERFRRTSGASAKVGSDMAAPNADLADLLAAAGRMRRQRASDRRLF